MPALDHSLPSDPLPLRDGRAVQLVVARPEHARGLWQLNREIVEAGEGVVLVPEELPTSPQAIALHEDDLQLLALSEGRVVGEVSVRRIHRVALRHNGTLTLGVIPDFQGVGLGRLLTATALRWGDDNGLYRIELNTLAENTRARSLYASLGFVDVFTRQRFIRWPDGRAEDDLTMLRLTTPPPARRPVTEADSGQLRVWLRAARPELAMLPPPLVDMQLSAQERHYAEAYPERRHSLLLHEGEAVGRLLTQEEEEVIRVIDLLIDPAARGRGLGGATLRQLQRQAASQGLGLLFHATRENAANRLYGRLGFSIVPLDPVYNRLTWRPKLRGAEPAGLRSRAQLS